MKTQTTTMSSKGQLVIPAEMRASLGISTGTRIAITLDGDRLVLRPVTARFIDEMMGRFAGGPSMTDELIAERRAEDEKW
jgi:AbrB family looped-hinge helix DNA binding protein